MSTFNLAWCLNVSKVKIIFKTNVADDDSQINILNIMKIDGERES